MGVVWFVYVRMCEEVREWESALGWLLFCSLVWLKTPHSDETRIFFGVNVTVHLRVRKCLREEDEVGRQTPTLLWMQWLFVYLSGEAVCCLCWLPHMGCVAPFWFILCCFTGFCSLKETERNLEKVCYSILCWALCMISGIYPNSCSISEESSMILSRGAKEVVIVRNKHSKCLLPITSDDAVQLDFIGDHLVTDRGL